MASKLSQLRLGTPPYKIVDIRGLKVAVVILSSDITIQIDQEVQRYESENPDSVNDNIKDRIFDIKLCYHCMRDPDNINVKIADSEEEVGQTLDVEDISRITGAYSELMINKAPKIELLTEEELDELKKYLEVTPLKDLSTVSLVHLTNFHQTILSEK